MTQSQSGTRLALGLCAIIALPILFLLETGVAFARGWRSDSRLDLLLLYLASFALIVPCFALLARPLRRWIAASSSQLTVCAGALLLAMLSGELVVRAAFEDAIEYHTRGANLDLTLKPNASVVPGMDRETHYTTNSRGIRGPQFPPRENAYRILCVGASTTECNYLNDDKTWTQLLMNRLNSEPEMPDVWVGGVGISGYTAEEHVQFVRESKLVDEVDCIVLLVGVNDFQWAVSPPPLTWGRGPTPLWAQSALIDRVRILGRGLAPRGPMVIEDSLGDVRQARREMTVVDTLPDLTDAVSVYEQRIRTISEYAKKRDTRIVLATQPTVWRDNLSPKAVSLLWFGWMGEGRCLSVDKMRVGMRQFNEAMISTANEISVPYVDLSSLDGNEALFIDDCHFSESGGREVARSIAEWFIQNRSGNRWSTGP